MFSLVILSLPTLTGVANAHTVDSVGDYRLEIGWMNEPAVSGETNGIELYISPLDPELSLDEQKFKNGITGLEKSLKIQLVYKGQKVTFPILEDHNVAGKYYSLVDPTRGGYYQANILGNIEDTKISLSMHPPKVENKTYLEFPPETSRLMTEHEGFREEIGDLKTALEAFEDHKQIVTIAYLGVGLGIIGIVIGAISFSRRK